MRCICSQEAESVMSLSQKVELLDLLPRGKSAPSVSRYYGVNESTLHYIKKTTKANCGGVMASAVCSTKVAVQVGHSH